MNFIQKKLAAGAALLMLGVGGCSTPQGTREDYFGYNNQPVIEEEEYTPAAETPKKTWRNPLAESPRTAVVYYEPVFVPVTAPWWDRYYGWEDYHHSHVFVMYPHHRVRYRYWDYTYASYPYYGGSPYYGGYPYYDHPHHSYPVSREVQPVEEKKTSRRFGSSRGTVNPDSEKDTRGADNSNWKVRGRGESQPAPVSERTSETTTTSTSRSRTSGVKSRGSSSRGEEKAKTSSTSTSKKSDSGSSTRSEPKKSETKETKTKARGRGDQ